MRHFQMCLIILAIAMVFLFMVQNLTSVTTALLGWSLTLPLSLLTVGAYLDLFGLDRWRGMVTSAAFDPRGFLRPFLSGSTVGP